MKKMWGFLRCCVILLLAARAGYAQEMLRGRVTVDAEPVWVTLARNDDAKPEYPLSEPSIQRAALSAAIGYFSGMVYGWAFEYEVGEKARNLADAFEWTPLGELPFGDARMLPSDSVREGSLFHLWADYEMDASQTARRNAWLGGQLRQVNARGRAGLRDTQQDALREAAKQAARSLVRGIERERPKSVRGRIALAAFPVITLAEGEWVASAKFFIEIQEVRKFHGY
jgi:hypothetical protein